MYMLKTPVKVEVPAVQHVKRTSAKTLMRKKTL